MNVIIIKRNNDNNHNNNYNNKANYYYSCVDWFIFSSWLWVVVVLGSWEKIDAPEWHSIVHGEFPRVNNWINRVNVINR